MTSSYIIADCQDAIKDIENDSVDFIYFNPPFGTTNASYDKPLDWDFLFPHLFRIIKNTGVIAIHCSIPFTYELISKQKPKYHYTWIKKRPTGHLNAKKQPLRNVEEILIYYKSPQHTYNIQMKGDKEKKEKRENKKYSQYYRSQKSYESTYKGDYPRTLLGIFEPVSQRGSPKSIPDLITRYMMLTYSNEEDVILDLTCCNKNNGFIAEELGRHYIGIDIDDKYLK